MDTRTDPTADAHDVALPGRRAAWSAVIGSWEAGLAAACAIVLLVDDAVGWACASPAPSWGGSSPARPRSSPSRARPPATPGSRRPGSGAGGFATS